MGSPLRFAESGGNKGDSPPSASELDFSEGCCLGFENLQLVEVRGYTNWEESFLVKFREFLGFSTSGHERGLINMLRNQNEKKSPCESRGPLGPSKCDRELRKLDFTINYNG